MSEPAVPPPAPRHGLPTRLWHWLNVVCLVVLFMSGLNISNAHPQLYWGEWGYNPREAWLRLPDFPGWATIPGYYSLAEARAWHLLAAWPFAVGLLLFLLAALATGHWRDLATGRADWRWAAIRRDLAQHLRLDFSAHRGAYNFLQRLLYGLVVFIALPLMIFTGLAMSPAMDAAWPWLTEAFGGRQSARSVHFIVAWTLLAFLVVHVVAVLLSGPVAQMRAMITGARR